MAELSMSTDRDTIRLQPSGTRNWLLLTPIGYALGFAAGFVAGHVLLGNVMVGICIGLGAGLAQWLVLRRRYSNVSAFWAVAPAAGALVGGSLLAAVTAVTTLPYDLGWPVGVAGWAGAFAIGGAISGALQSWMIARRRKGSETQATATGWTARERNWPWISALAWGVSTLGLAIPPDMDGNYDGWLFPLLIARNLLLAPIVAGLILSALTAWPANRLVREKTS